MLKVCLNCTIDMMEILKQKDMAAKSSTPVRSIFSAHGTTLLAWPKNEHASVSMEQGLAGDTE